jgi:hypothetical protein
MRTYLPLFAATFIDILTPKITANPFLPKTLPLKSLNSKTWPGYLGYVDENTRPRGRGVAVLTGKLLRLPRRLARIPLRCASA